MTATPSTNLDRPLLRTGLWLLLGCWSTDWLTAGRQTGERQRASQHTESQRPAHLTRHEGYLADELVRLPQANLPGWAYTLYELNPMTGAISLIRMVFLGEQVPLSTLGTSIAGTCLLLGIGIVVFRRLAPRFSTA